MINKKEDPNKVMPLPGWVRVEIPMPEKIVSKGGIILTPKRDETFKEVTHYKAKVTAIGDGVPAHITVGSTYRVDVFAGTMIPTTGKKMVKVVEHTLLLGEEKNKTAEGYLPNHERLLVKVTSLVDKTEAGIYIPKDPSSLFDMDTLGGQIVSVSPDLGDRFAIGETIRWEAFQGITMDFEGDTTHNYISVPVYAVLAKIAA